MASDVAQNQTFTMTDTDDASGYTRGSNCDVYTTGVGETAITPKVATRGGTAGTTAHSISVPKSELNVEVISIIMDPVTALTTWTESPAGTFAFSFEVVTNDANIYVDDIAVCRLTSAGANRATLGSGSYTSTTGALSVGVNTFNLSMNTSTSGLADDLILIAVAMSNLAAHSSADITVRLNQNITPNLIFTYERQAVFSQSATAAVLAAPDFSEYLLADFFQDEVVGYKTISVTDAADGTGSWVPIDTDGEVYVTNRSGNIGWAPRRGDEP
jgi:hypothetical protein